MTVTSTVSRVTYNTNGSTTGPFVVGFYFLADTDLVVQTTIAGIVSTLVKDTDYTVSGAGNPSGGSVTTLAAQPTGTLTIYRDPAMIQDASYQDHGRFPAASHERALDRRTMVEQRLAERCDDLQSKIDVINALLLTVTVEQMRLAFLSLPTELPDEPFQLWLNGGVPSIS
jgi:hypothetical protein